MSPQRIQRRRTKGWCMPENTVYVGRGSQWGNPYKVTELTTARQAVNGYRYGVASPIMKAVIRKDLSGKNLACWCPLDQPCHADVLLEIANEATK